MLTDDLILILFSISISFWSKTVFCPSFCERLTLLKAFGKILNSITQVFFNHCFNDTKNSVRSIIFAKNCVVWILQYDVSFFCLTVLNNAKPSLEISKILQGSVVGILISFKATLLF